MSSKKAAGSEVVKVTRQETQVLMAQVSKLLAAFGDGRIQVVEDGDNVPMRTVDRMARPMPAPHKVVKETRQPVPEDGQSSTQVKRQRAQSIGGQTGPRVLYQLHSPEKGKLDLSGLTPAGKAIVRYMAANDHVSVQGIMTDLKLKRSTVMNSLGLLRKKRIAVSMPAMEVAHQQAGR